MLLTDGELKVRPPLPEDDKAVADAVRSSFTELEPWMVWAKAAYSVDDAAEWRTGAFGDVHPFVILDGDGRVVGSCGINEHDAANKRANLGYWLRTDTTGRGFAARATRLVARYGIEFAKYRRLEVVVAVGNEKSRAVAERSGATYEGIARTRLLHHGESRDAHIFSFVAGDTL